MVVIVVLVVVLLVGAISWSRERAAVRREEEVRVVVERLRKWP